MTASPATTLPNPRGTAFVHETKRTGDTEPFYSRRPDETYEPVAHSVEEGYPKARANNAKALRTIALQVLSEPRLTNPNVRYARAVLRARLEDLRIAKDIDVEDYDLISTAFDVGVEHAALAVAAAWLLERGSLPIPAE